MKKPVALIILDGVGIAPHYEGNAVTLANTPNIDKWREEYPSTQITAHGELVGLPQGQMGNSEVGHLNIGAGRIVYQSLTLINKHIKENTLKDNKTLKKAIQHAKDNNSKVNLFSLISDGGVHSHIDHIIALAKIIRSEDVDVVLHAFTDGRDVAPTSAITFIEKLKTEDIEISSISGRYFSMDRDKRWERVDQAFDALKGNAKNFFTSAVDYVREQNDEGITDEFIIPASKKNGKFVDNNDSIIFANFRPDRARELSHYFVGSDLNITHYGHAASRKFENIYFASLMELAGVPTNVMFPPTKMNNLLGETLQEQGYKQIRAAETEKYPHVTFFMDGGEETSKENETRVLVDSPKVATYDLEPEMSSRLLTDKIIKNANDTDVFIINYAQPDMVGHTGVIPAVIKSVEVADEMLKKLYDKIVVEMGGVMIITADHGNAEEMLDENNNPVTKHTTNPVEVIITDKAVELQNIDGKLANLAPTILKLLGANIPQEMEEPLIK